MARATTKPAIEGALLGLAWLGGLYVASPFVGGFAVVDVAQWIIFTSPGWLGAIAVDTLGFYAIPSVVLGVVAGFVAATAALRIAWTRLPSVHPGTAYGLGVLATAGLLLATGAREPATIVAGVGLGVLPPVLVVRFLGDERAAPGRRSFLGRVGTIAVGGTLSFALLRAGVERALDPDRDGDGRRPDPNGDATAGDAAAGDADTADGADETPGATREVALGPDVRLPRDVSPPRGDSSFSFGRMPDAVTSPRDHYVVDINVDAPMVDSNKPDIDPEEWTLDVDGEVSRPYSLSYEDLLDHEASVEQTATMICISNRVGGDLIGTAHWTGVQLSDLVGEAGPSDTAVNVVTRAVDGYTEAIPIDLVEREDILIAYGMGHRTLPRDHGFPVRLLIPGRYGMKMTKWIDRIEIVDDEHESHYEARGWDGEGIVNTMSYLRGFERDDDRVAVGGVAFGGLETGVQEIDRVEVSVDGGDTWDDAELEHRLDVHAWRRWKYEFESPERTRYEFVCRAVRRDGTVQTAEESGSRPGGATGWHRVTREI